MEPQQTGPETPRADLPPQDGAGFALSVLAGVTGLMLILTWGISSWSVTDAELGGPLGTTSSRAILAVGVGLLTLSITLNLDRLWEVIRQRRTRHAVHALTLSVLAFAALVLVNYVFARHNATFDWTTDQRYTLSEESKNLVRTLPAGLEVKVTLLLPLGQGQQDQLEVLLEQYRQASEGKLSIERVDLRQLALSEQRALYERLNFSGRSMDQVVGVVVQSGNEGPEGWLVQQSKHLPFNELWQMENSQRQGSREVFQGERKMSSAILEVTEERKPKAYLIVGHDELPDADQQGRGLSLAIQKLRERNFEAEPLRLLDAERVPEDADLVIVAGSKRPWLDAEVEKLQAYLDGGGDALICMEPVAERVTATSTEYVSTGLETLLAEQYGVITEDRHVLLDSADLQQREAMFFVDLSRDHPTTESIATQGGLVLFLAPRPLHGLTPSEDVTTTRLAATRADHGDKIFATGRPYQERPEDKAYDGPYELVIASERVLERPEEGEPTGDQVSRVVVFGDADWMITGIMSNPQFMNLELFLNAVSWSIERSDRVVGKVHRPGSYRLFMNEAELMFFILLSLVGAPAFAIGCGVLAWLVRRR